MTANTQAFQANAPASRQALASVTVTVLLVIVILSGPKPWAQGPPFQTDDPVPVDLHHYEFYVFGAADGTPVEMDSVGPAFEFNWGAWPRVQFHAILPFGVVAPLNNPVYAPSGIGRTEFGLTDMELGAKIAFIKEGKHVPQIGTFTMFEIPTGNADKGLGVGKVWYKIPIWLQKNVGKWTIDGGAGYQVVPQDGFRNFPYTGWLLKKELSERLELGAEIFAHGREGNAAAQTGASTMRRRGRLLPLQAPSRRAVPVVLRSFRRRTDGELRVPGNVLDLGEKSRRQRGRTARRLVPWSVEPERILT